MKVDPDIVIPNKDLSILEGAICASGWNNIRGDGISRMYFDALAQQFKFKLDTPVKKLPPEVLDIILYGSQRENSPPLRPAPGQGDIVSVWRLSTTWSAATGRPTATAASGIWRT